MIGSLDFGIFDKIFSFSIKLIKKINNNNVLLLLYFCFSFYHNDQLLYSIFHQAQVIDLFHLIFLKFLNFVDLKYFLEYWIIFPILEIAI